MSCNEPCSNQVFLISWHARWHSNVGSLCLGTVSMDFPRLVGWVCSICIALTALVLVSPAMAEKGKLRERLTPQVMAVVYPGGAERLGPEEGSPPAIAVYQGDMGVAYIFSPLHII